MESFICLHIHEFMTTESCSIERFCYRISGLDVMRISAMRCFYFFLFFFSLRSQNYLITAPKSEIAPIFIFIFFFFVFAHTRSHILASFKFEIIVLRAKQLVNDKTLMFQHWANTTIISSAVQMTHLPGIHENT